MDYCFICIKTKIKKNALRFANCKGFTLKMTILAIDLPRTTKFVN